MGRGMAEVAGVQLGVPDYLQVQLDTGSMLCSLALVQARGHRALARRGQQYGGVVTGGAPFFFLMLQRGLPWGGVSTHTGTIPGSQGLVPGVVLVLGGEEGEGRVSKG